MDRVQLADFDGHQFLARQRHFFGFLGFLGVGVFFLLFFRIISRVDPLYVVATVDCFLELFALELEEVSCGLHVHAVLDDRFFVDEDHAAVVVDALELLLVADRRLDEALPHYAEVGCIHPFNGLFIGPHHVHFFVDLIHRSACELEVVLLSGLQTVSYE